MATDKRGKFPVCVSNAETAATTWRIAHMDSVAYQMQREIDGITSKEQMWCKKQLSIRMNEFLACWKAIGVDELRQTIEQHVIHFEYPKMHLVSHILKSIRQMGSVDILTPDNAEQICNGNVREAYQCKNKVNYIRHMLKHNDWCAIRDHLEETQLVLATVPFSDRFYYSGSMKTRTWPVRSGFGQNSSSNYLQEY
jgi:hypothetical protein